VEEVEPVTPKDNGLHQELNIIFQRMRPPRSKKPFPEEREPSLNHLFP
jgi:hypothetical protein